MTNRIMIIDDQQEIRTSLCQILIKEGYTVYPVTDETKTMQHIRTQSPDLILLDLLLPSISGETLCKEIRQRYPQMKILMLTAKTNISELVEGFTIGADDYIKKPFQTQELLARIKAHLRHTNPTDILCVGDMTLNTKTYEVKRGDMIISLTPQEFKLMHFFMTNQGKVLSREELLRHLWKCSSDIESRVIDVYVGYLRKKVDTSYDKKLFSTVRGIGYILRD